MKKVIIFDLDGTMFDNENIYHQAHVIMFKKRNLDYQTSSFVNLKGLKTIDIMQKYSEFFKEKFGENTSKEELLKEQDNIVFKNYQEEVKMKKGLREFLDFLNQNKIRKALATTARLSTVKILFDKYNLWSEFEVIISAEDIQFGKPNPEVYEKVLQKLNTNDQLEKADCLAIEDTKNGIASAVSAGLEVVVIPNSLNLNQNSDFSLATHQIESFADLKLKDIVLE